MGADARLERTVTRGEYSAVALSLYFPYFCVNTFCLTRDVKLLPFWNSLLERPLCITLFH